MAAFFYLIPDNHTADLAARSPPWGEPIADVPDMGLFQMTDWHDLGHVILHRLASHPARTRDASSASCCVVASPAAGRGTGASPLECRRGSAEAQRLRGIGASACPGKPIVVIDGPDADGLNTALCESLWSGDACAAGLADTLVRVTGSAPSITAELMLNLGRSRCRYIETPYLAHARSHLAAARPPASRGFVSVGYSAATFGHNIMMAHGFVAWRKALRNACGRARGAGPPNHTACEYVWVSMSGRGADKALPLYARSDFCLQPPGDALPRGGIIDAVTTGCVPVLLHPLQARLWRGHWDVSTSAVLLDWTDGVPRPRGRDPAAFADRAREAIGMLLNMPAHRLAALRAGVAAAAAGLVYRREHDPLAPPDAIQILVGRMRALTLVAGREEQEWYARQRREAAEDARAQDRHQVGRRRGATKVA